MDNLWETKKEIDLDPPADRVFEYLSDWTRIVEWDPSVVWARKASPGEPAVGSRFDLMLRYGWKRIPMTYTITRMEPHRILCLAGRGPRFRAVDRIQLAQRPGGTRLTYAVAVTFSHAPNRLVHHLGKKWFDRYAEKTVRRLGRMLSGAARPPVLSPMTRMADQAILPGLMGFTRLGHALARGRRPVASALYRGRTVVLTGGTSGIGKAAARDLYRKGAHLVVVGRDAHKLDALRGELTALRGGTLETEVADLSLLAEVRRLSARLVRRHPRIDVLINNAGALFNRYVRTGEGFESTLATDLLSPYLLTRLLLPALRSAGAARIINVASGGMYTQAMRAAYLTPSAALHDGPTAYARAKRGLVILTHWWARELAPAGISVHAMHPGWVDTPGLRRSLPAFHRQLSAWLRTPAQGADTIVWLAGSPDAPHASGRFWLDRKIRAPHVFRHTRTAPEADFRLIGALNHLCGLSPSDR